MVNKLMIYKTNDRRNVIIQMDSDFVMLDVSTIDLLMKDILVQLVIDDVMTPEKILLRCKKGANAPNKQ
jgi:hypothetical protein